jgi:prophage regulatory protein
MMFGGGKVKVLSYDELRDLKGVRFSRVHLWRLEKHGKFPKRVRLSANRHGWSDEEIDAWIASRMASRNGEAA